MLLGKSKDMSDLNMYIQKAIEQAATQLILFRWDHRLTCGPLFCSYRPPSGGCLAFFLGTAVLLAAPASSPNSADHFVCFRLQSCCGALS